MNWKNLKRYSNKEVRYKNIKTLDDYTKENSLQETILILHFAKKNFTDDNLDKFFDKIISDLPLVVIIMGEDSSEYFYKLLEALSIKKTKKHIMTNLFDSSNFYELFDETLKGVWPAEERFNSWVHYSVLHVGNSSEQKEIERVLNKIK